MTRPHREVRKPGQEKRGPRLQNPHPSRCCFVLRQNPGFGCLFFQVFQFLVLSAWAWLNSIDVNGKCVLTTKTGGADLPAAYEYCFLSHHGLPRWHSGKEPACRCCRHKSHRFDSWVGKIPWRRAWQPIPAFLPRKSHGQKNLKGYSPQGHKKSDMTEPTHSAQHQPLP